MEIRKSVLLQPNDLITDSLLLEEGYAAMGVSCKINIAQSRIPEVGYKNDVQISNQDIYTNILFDDAPSPKLIKQLGWNIDGEDNPLIATIPRYISSILPGQGSTKFICPLEYYELKIGRYSLIEADWDYDNPSRVFEVTAVNENMINPTFYYLKLVPYHKRSEVDPTPVNDPNLIHTRKEGQFNHLNISREDSHGKTPIIH